MAGDLWYLSEKLVGLAFFDNDVSADTKTKRSRLWIAMRKMNNHLRELRVRSIASRKKPCNHLQQYSFFIQEVTYFR